VEIVPSLSGRLHSPAAICLRVAEFDKIVSTVIYDSTQTGLLTFQSSNNNVIVRNGSVVTVFNGTPRNLTLTDSTVSLIRMGPTAFGRMESFTTSGARLPILITILCRMKVTTRQASRIITLSATAQFQCPSLRINMVADGLSPAQFAISGHITMIRCSRLSFRVYLLQITVLTLM